MSDLSIYNYANCGEYTMFKPIEFLGIWEEIYNPNFNSPEFEGIKNQAGLNRFALSVKQWRGENPDNNGNIRDDAVVLNREVRRD